ncbi:hypothetical protein ZWY2020_016432 [Hordeum vulgare]|nr:hypothetical protein ZWY2020_016432 [Hordeum vulgare]
MKHGARVSPVTPGSFGGDPDTADTASSPVKSHVVVMEVDKHARKRLHMDKAELVPQMVIDFSASWCGPCRFIEPAFKEMASRFADALSLLGSLTPLPTSQHLNY